MLLVGQVAYAQLMLPVTFDDATINYRLADFGGTSSSIVADPTNAGNKVVRTVKTAGAETWGGTTVGEPIGFASRLPFTAANTKMSVRVWSPDAGIKVRLKVEQAGVPQVSVETEATTTVANEWQTLVFDFANHATGTAALNLSSTYEKASIFFNFGVTGAVAGEKVYYWDDVEFGAGAAGPAGPTLPLTFENASIDWEGIITNFGGGELTRVENPSKTGINTSDNVLKMVKNAGDPWGGSFFALGETIDLNKSTEFTLKVWSPRAGANLLFKLENAGNTVAFEQIINIPVANEWVELTYDFSAANRTASYKTVVLIFDMGTVGDGTANFTAYIDDINQTAAAPPPPPPPITFPITFEQSDIPWDALITNFNGGMMTRVENPDKSGLNTSNHVLKMVKNAGEIWGGSFFSMPEPINFTTVKEFKVLVWSPRADAKLLFKVENASDGGINFEKEVTIGVANAWTELTFDYSEINTANQYSKVVLIFDLGTVGDGSSNFTFYIDNIVHGEAVVPPAPELVFPVTAEEPGINWETLFNGFSGGVLSRIENPDKSGLNTSNHVFRMVKNAGDPWGGAWFPLTANFDLSAGKSVFKVLVWSPRADAKMLFKIENETNGGINVEQEKVVGVANAWTELTFDFSGTSTTNTYRKIVMIFDNGTVGDGSANFTYYIDNIRQVVAETPPAPPVVFPVTFENSDIPWATMFTGFGGGVLTRIANPDKSGINTSDYVARMVKNTGDPWGGAWFRMTEPINMTNKTFKVNVWSPRADAKLLFKLEADTDGAQNVELERVIGVANQWTEVSFDMSHANPAHIYQKVVLIFELGTVGDGSANFTFYLDDITNVEGVSVERVSEEIPGGIALSQNYPNPFNPTTVIGYQLATAGDVRLSVFDLLGREVEVLVNQNQSAGSYKVTFDAMNLTSGVYLYRLQSGSKTLTGKMLLVK